MWGSSKKVKAGDKTKKRAFLAVFFSLKPNAESFHSDREVVRTHNQLIKNQIFYDKNLVRLYSGAQILNDVRLLPSMQDVTAELVDDLVKQTEVNLNDHIFVV